MTSSAENRRSSAMRRAIRVLIVALPAMLAGSTALADLIFFSIGHGTRWHRPHHFHHHHRYQHGHGFHVRHVYRPPVVVYRRVVVDRPVAVPYPYAQTCTHGLWRHADGSMVEGVACKQPDGSWRMEP